MHEARQGGQLSGRQERDKIFGAYVKERGRRRAAQHRCKGAAEGAGLEEYERKFNRPNSEDPRGLEEKEQAYPSSTVEFAVDLQPHEKSVS